jgi:hypothetical protein
MTTWPAKVTQAVFAFLYFLCDTIYTFPYFNCVDKKDGKEN